MAKRPQKKNYNIDLMQPDEIGALRNLVKDFVTKINSIDNEIELLKGDRKEIIEEYSTKLDMKTLQAALRVLKIQEGIAHKDTYDLFWEALTGMSPSEQNEED
jgi:uncharacterized protein (UPF0335 family)